MRRLVLTLLIASCSSPQSKPEPPPVIAAATPATDEPALDLQKEEDDGRNDESIRIANSAVDAANQGNFEEALELITKATSVDRQNHNAWFVQGQLRSHAKDPEGAVEAFSEAIRVKDDDANYHYRLGRAHWTLSQTENLSQAQRALERSVQLKPDLYMALHYLGQVYEKQGQASKAAQAWTTAATLEPTFGRTFDLLGALYIRWHKLDEALLVLNHGRLHVKDPDELFLILYDLGLAHTRKNDWSLAILAYSKALEIQPKNLDALRQRGFAYAKHGDAKNAESDLKAFLDQGGMGDAFYIQAANTVLAGLRSKRSKSPGAKIPTVFPSDSLSTGKPVAMPVIPEFEIPAMSGDAHRVGEMLVRGKPLLDTEIKIRGTIVWIYDCAKAIQTPGMSKRKLKRLLREEPERCTRPHFHLADDKKASVDRQIQVVDVPRKLRPDERSALGDDVIENWPEVPVLKVGEEVIVTGTWATRSPKGFSDSEGLLVYKAIEHIR